jgi:hypothetical protein
LSCQYEHTCMSPATPDSGQPLDPCVRTKKPQPHRSGAGQHPVYPTRAGSVVLPMRPGECPTASVPPPMWLADFADEVVCRAEEGWKTRPG